MAVRDDINAAVLTQIQRFRERPLTAKEIKEIEEDVMAFCIIEIRKFCGEDIFEVITKEDLIKKNKLN